MLILGLVGLCGSAAMAQQQPGVVSVHIAEVNDVPIDVLIDPDGEWSINPEAQKVRAGPGDVLTLEVWARCWTNANDLTMVGYQVTFPYATYFTGISGNVLPLDHKTTADPDNLCPGYPGGSPNPNAFVDLAHPFFVFASFPVFWSPDTACDYRLTAASLGPTRIGRCPEIPPQYLATIKVQVSGDAEGLFEVCLDPDENLSYLRYAAGVVIQPVEFECAWIQVGGCSSDDFCDNGLFCDGEETCDGDQCAAGVDPCAPGVVCDEENDECELPPCTDDSDCPDDGQFCNGVEMCDLSGKEEEGVCVSVDPPCEGLFCDEDGDRCCDCLGDADCDNGLFCDGEETCDPDSCVCQAGADPCPEGVECDEDNDRCSCELEILGSYPPDGAIDARQPSDLDGSNPQGWNFVNVVFDNDATCLTAEDFTVTITPENGTAPIVIDVEANANSASLFLDSRIPPGHWTQITHNDDTPTSICLGYLPADVSGDGTSGPLDILRLIDCLNNVATCEIHQGDANRSDETNVQDILRVIDLLNGAEEFEVWNGVSIGASPCD